MGNFCTQCGRPLQEGEVCNCTAQAAPSQTSREIKQGFENLITALKTVWINPAKAASALAKKESWLPALILIAAQALLSGFFALTNYGVGLEHDDAVSLVISFFFTFFFSVALSAAAMGMYLGIGKAVKADVCFKSSLATASIRSFVCLPFTLIGLLTGIFSVETGMFFFFFGEVIAAFLSILAVEENYKVNANRAFLIVGSTYVVLYILFMIFAALFNAVNPTDIFTFVKGSSYSRFSDWFD